MQHDIFCSMRDRVEIYLCCVLSLAGQRSLHMLNTFIQGFVSSGALILAIGAQNAFVLKQGLKKQAVFWVCLVCALSDSILITLGILGFGKVIQLYPQMMLWAKYLGAVFLLFYGAQHFYQAYRMQNIALGAEAPVARVGQLILMCLALTWLNPHVYLDTVILLGAISTQFAETQLYFALGAISASWLFFFSLGYAARWLSPWFYNAKAWQVLDLIIGCSMWVIALLLLNMEL